MTAITILHPDNYLPERNYVFQVLFSEFLGLNFCTRAESRQDVCILLAGRQNSAALRVRDGLFQSRPKDWLTSVTIPRLPLETWDLSDSEPMGQHVISRELPVIYGARGENGEFLAETDSGIELGLDIFGSAFFMLSRYEEACSESVDKHCRFPVTDSLAYKAGFLDRPIVNEYLEILWHCLEKLFPGLKRAQREYRAVITHDVDRMFDTRGKRWPTVIRNASGDLTKRKDPGLAVRRLLARLDTDDEQFRYEPTNTFDFIMGCSERIGVCSAFYFITCQRVREIDGDYSMDMPWVRRLLGRIHARGHEIGLHGSYDSYNRKGLLEEEFDKLLAVAEEEGIWQERWGGRQHYLRWEAGATWQNQDDVGLHYDSSLGHPEQAGFRCGTCFEYPVFNLKSRRQLRLRERPLVVMEASLLGKLYMNLTLRDAVSRVERFADICRRYDGDLTLLWHNGNLVQRRQREAYLQALESVR